VAYPPLAYPGGAAGTGGYVTNFVGIGGKGQAEIIVSYSRDPKTFAVNKLCTITPVKLMQGLWAKVDPSILASIYNDPNEALWPDGQPRPLGPQNTQAWGALQYSAVRRAEPYPIGYQEREQSIMPLETMATQALAHRAMTRRAFAFYTQSLNIANYPATNTFNCTAQVGGKWSAATGTSPYIQASLQYLATQINQQTLGALNMNDLTLVLSPSAATLASQTQEIREYLARSQFALDQLRGDKPGQNAAWGMPDQLYGMKLVVDPTIINAAARLQGLSPSYVDGATTALVLCRPGDIPSNVTQLQSTFSTWHFFVYEKEEMLTETWDDWFNKRIVIGMTDTFDIKPVAIETGGLITAIF
jgi:hypothetical protein